MEWKVTSRTVFWLSSLAVLFIFVSSFISISMDLPTKHRMYVKIEHKPFYLKQCLPNLSCASGQTFTKRDELRNISSSNGSGDADVDFELSSLTEDGRVLDNFDKGGSLLPTVDDANAAEENDNVSALDMKNGFYGDVRSLDQNISYRYDPQVYVDLYKNMTINDVSKKTTDSPPVIIIMAQWRFGSSVFGELFNQNSDLFYLFEPLYTTTELRKQKGIGLFTPESRQNMSRNILRKLSRCQFDPDFVKILGGWGGKNKNKAICKASRRCRIKSTGWMSGLCRKYKGRVASKLIRVDLELLRPLMVDDNINLKIIHLVRDPRGSALSRIKYKLSYSGKISPTVRSQVPKHGRLKPLNLFSVTPETGQTVRGMCKWIRKNAVVSPDLLPTWLQSRYYLVRYEDFADTPLKVTQDLYRFVGIPFKKEVQDWVIKNTRKTVRKNDLFSTHRNSQVAATHWIKDLTEMEVGQIEEECKDVLELMGYEPYSQLIHQEKSTR
eukprot:XP_011669110.1 PREDICTED: carbohydrate sulfotransferase 3-like [Strongylocentrotus purpuratus]